MDREVIQEIKTAALLEDWETATKIAIANPEEAIHAGIEHEVGKLVFQNEDE